MGHQKNRSSLTGVAAGIAVLWLTMAGAAAQAQDRLVLKNGNILMGHLAPVTCSESPQISFQPVDLALLTLGLDKIVTIQAGNYALDASNTTADPDDQQTASIRGYLTTTARTAPGPVTTLSLARVAAKVCTAPKPSFKGRIKLDGNTTFGATIQRQIGGAFNAQLNPANHDRGSITPVITLTTSYGDQIKSGRTSKSVQVYTGRFDMQVRLNRPRTSGPLGNTDLHFIADEYHSFSQGIDLQQGYGMGISQEVQGAVLQGDFWYVQEKRFSPAPTFSSMAGRVFESYAVFPEKRFTLVEDCEIVLPFKSLNALLVRGSAGVVMKLGKSTAPPFSLSLTYSDYYFRNAPVTYKQSYSKVGLGIVYAW